VVLQTLKGRGINVNYGDIRQCRYAGGAAGVGKSEIIILSVPGLFRAEGRQQRKLVRHVPFVNTTARIISTAEPLSDRRGPVPRPAADYVVVTRSATQRAFNVIEAADQGLLDDKRAEIDGRLSERSEVLP